MKRIFITGASSGIGLATATLLSGRGHEVWGTSRDLDRIPQLPRFHAVRLDLLDPPSLADSFGIALRAAGQFDVVINNAGSGHFGPAEFLSPEEVHVQFQTLVFAHIQICQLALRAMQDRGGRIINVTSLASRLPIPFMGAYNAAKAAMASFTAYAAIGARRLEHPADRSPARRYSNRFQRQDPEGRECRSALPGQTQAGLARSRPEHEKSAQS